MDEIFCADVNALKVSQARIVRTTLTTVAATSVRMGRFVWMGWLATSAPAPRGSWGRTVRSPHALPPTTTQRAACVRAMIVRTADSATSPLAHQTICAAACQVTECNVTYITLVFWGLYI